MFFTDLYSIYQHQKEFAYTESRHFADQLQKPSDPTGDPACDSCDHALQGFFSERQEAVDVGTGQKSWEIEGKSNAQTARQRNEMVPSLALMWLGDQSEADKSRL